MLVNVLTLFVKQKLVVSELVNDPPEAKTAPVSVFVNVYDPFPYEQQMPSP